MSTDVEKVSAVERKLFVTIPAGTIDAAVESELAKVAKTAQVDGFRPGKVPMAVLRKRYSAAARAKVLEELIPKKLTELFEHHKLSPIGVPTLKMENNTAGQDLTFYAHFEVYPEVEVTGVENIVLEKVTAVVTEPDVDRMLETLRKQQATWKTVERAAQMDDRVTIDFEGTLEGKPFEGGQGKEVPLILGSKQMIEGFESGLIGAKAGDVKTLSLHFPKDYFSKELAGKPVVFSVTVKSVSEAELPPLDEALAERFKTKDLKALREEVKANMERELEFTLNNSFKTQLLNALLKDNMFEVPKALVTQEVQHLKEQALTNMGLAHLKDKKEFQLPDDLFSQEAKKRVQLGVLMHKVVETYQLKADPEQVQIRMRKMASVYENPEEAIQEYEQDKQEMAHIEQAVLEDCVVAKLSESAKITSVEKSFYDVMGNRTV